MDTDTSVAEWSWTEAESRCREEARAHGQHCTGAKSTGNPPWDAGHHHIQDGDLWHPILAGQIAQMPQEQDTLSLARDALQASATAGSREASACSSLL